MAKRDNKARKLLASFLMGGVLLSVPITAGINALGDTFGKPRIEQITVKTPDGRLVFLEHKNKLSRDAALPDGSLRVCEKGRNYCGEYRAEAASVNAFPTQNGEEEDSTDPELPTDCYADVRKFCKHSTGDDCVVWSYNEYRTPDEKVSDQYHFLAATGESAHLICNTLKKTDKVHIKKGWSRRR